MKLTTAWGTDDDIVEDVITVFRAWRHDTLGYGLQFEAIVREWRPELVTDVSKRLKNFANS